MQKSKIQGILPLTFMQQALLFHSLSADSDDQGFLHVKCILKGNLNIEKFQKAWNDVVARHEVFRTSIHWEKLEKPLQVIHPNLTIPFTFKDWSSLSLEAQETQLKEFKTTDRIQGLDLNKAPISRLTLVKTKSEEYILLWACHHILFDGWSASNVVKDVLSFYEAEVKNETIHLDKLPSFKSYLKELDTRDASALESFWKSYLDGFSKPALIANTLETGHQKLEYSSSNQIISSELSEKIKNTLRQNRLTINTFIQGVWSLLLARYIDQKDVAFGSTVSVRSEHLENADLMAGLFTNMLPVRIKLNESQSFFEWLKDVQDHQAKTRNHQQVTLNEIMSWADWPGYFPLFDHLLVVENFPWEAFTKAEVTVQEFSSGITTTYPMTVIVKPLEEIEFVFQYDPNSVSEKLVPWLKVNLMRLINEVIEAPQQQLSLLFENLKPTNLETASHIANKLKEEHTTASRSIDPSKIVRPATKLEVQLTNIWEDGFGRSDIGVTDNFFELGGKSFLAVRLFTQINKQLDVKLSPISLLQYPSIRDIAKLIDKGEEEPWKSLVSIRTKGKQKPLYCLHAKGGYVFFYNDLAKYLGEDQPIYALQPKGLDGSEPVYGSIEEMATHYISEIKRVQPEGPYSILGTCLSNAVGLEMAHQLKNAGEEIGLLAMIDAAPGGVLTDEIERKKSLFNRISHELKEKSLSTTTKKIKQKVLGIANKIKESKLTQEEQTILNVQKQLSAIFHKYERPSYDGKITLIRSQEFSERTDKEFHINDWKGVATEKNLEVVVVPGSHSTLFVEPEVQGLAKELKQYLTKR